MPNTVRLECLGYDHATAIVDEWSPYSGEANTVHQDGVTVEIRYVDARYPLDVADWAYENGHASDNDAARVMAQP